MSEKSEVSEKNSEKSNEDIGLVGSAAGVERDHSRDALSGLLTTIQITVTVLSGLILLLGIGGAYFFGSKIDDLTNQAYEVVRNAEVKADRVLEKAEQQAKRVSEEAEGAIIRLANIYNDGLENKIDAALVEKISNDNNEFVKRSKYLEENFSNYIELRESVRDTLQALQAVKDSNEKRIADYSGSYAWLLENRHSHKDSLTDDQRKEYSLRLSIVIEGAKRRSITASEVFNASGIASQFGFHRQAHILAALAHWADPGKVYELRVLHLETAIGDRLRVSKINGENAEFEIVSLNPDADSTIAGQIRVEAFERAMQLVKDAPLPNTELILSEGWNIAEQMRRYTDYIAVLEQMVELRSRSERGDHVEQKASQQDLSEQHFNYFPSYGHLQLANAYMRLGAPGWRESAESHTKHAISKLQTESRHSTWYEATEREIGPVAELLGLSDLLPVNPPSSVSVGVNDVLSAMKLMKEIETTGREPTPEEMELLLRVQSSLAD